MVLWSHVRRRFDEAIKAQKNPICRAADAPESIGKLHRIN
jgi:hypothetical protein